MWLYTEPRHKAANGQVVPRGDTQSPHPGEHPGPTTQTLGKGNSLVSGSCPWRALESERLACLLNGQRHWLPGPPSPAGRSSLLLPQLRAWRSYLRRPCCLSGCSQLHLPRFRGHPCHARPPCSLSHPLPPHRKIRACIWPQRQALCSCPRKVGAGGGQGTGWRLLQGLLRERLPSWPSVKKKERKQSSLPCSAVCPRQSVGPWTVPGPPPAPGAQTKEAAEDQEV